MTDFDHFFEANWHAWTRAGRARSCSTSAPPVRSWASADAPCRWWSARAMPPSSNIPWLARARILQRLPRLPSRQDSFPLNPLPLYPSKALWPWVPRHHSGQKAGGVGRHSPLVAKFVWRPGAHNRQCPTDRSGPSGRTGHSRNAVKLSRTRGAHSVRLESKASALARPSKAEALDSSALG